MTIHNRIIRKPIDDYTGIPDPKEQEALEAKRKAEEERKRQEREAKEKRQQAELEKAMEIDKKNKSSKDILDRVHEILEEAGANGGPKGPEIRGKPVARPAPQHEAELGSVDNAYADLKNAYTDVDRSHESFEALSSDTDGKDYRSLFSVYSRIRQMTSDEMKKIDTDTHRDIYEDLMDAYTSTVRLVVNNEKGCVTSGRDRDTDPVIKEVYIQAIKKMRGLYRKVKILEGE